MKKIVLICMSVGIIILILFFPRNEYKIENLKGKIVFSAGTNEVIQKYVLNLEKREITSYTGVVQTEGIINSSHITGGINIYKNNLYKNGEKFVTIPKLTILKRFKYLHDNKYLFILDNKKERLGLFRFDLGKTTIKVLNLENGKIEQINFYDKNHPEYEIIDILGEVN